MFLALTLMTHYPRPRVGPFTMFFSDSIILFSGTSLMIILQKPRTLTSLAFALYRSGRVLLADYAFDHTGVLLEDVGHILEDQALLGDGAFHLIKVPADIFEITL